MNFMTIGTVSGFVKNLTLDMKWQERKQKINDRQDQQLSPEAANIKKWSEDQRRSQAVSSIHGKMLSGAPLSNDELNYLRANCPDLYEKAMQIQREREAYKKELSNCKSKEDVEKLSQRKMNEFINEAKSIITNPNIPKAKKAVMLEFITMRMNAVMNDHAEFIKSPGYQRLPEKAHKSERDSAGNDVSEITVDSETADEDEPGDPVKVIQDMISGLSSPEEQKDSGTAFKHSGDPIPAYTKQNAIGAYNNHVSQNVNHVSYKTAAKATTTFK